MLKKIFFAKNYITSFILKENTMNMQGCEDPRLDVTLSKKDYYMIGVVYKHSKADTTDF